MFNLVQVCFQIVSNYFLPVFLRSQASSTARSWGPGTPTKEITLIIIIIMKSLNDKYKPLTVEISCLFQLQSCFFQDAFSKSSAVSPSSKGFLWINAPCWWLLLSECLNNENVCQDSIVSPAPDTDVSAF